MVSVIVPVYNREGYIAQALQSILSQSFSDVEIIVVDDGSTDSTVEAVRSFGEGIRLFRQENRGPGAARNRGIREAKGDFIAFLDSDDLWDSEKLEKQVRILKKRPEVGLVYTDLQEIDQNGLFLQKVACSDRTGPIVTEFLGGHTPRPSATMVRRKLLEEIGGFDEELRYLEEVFLWILLIERTEFACIPEPLTFYRHHPRNMTRNFEQGLHYRGIFLRKLIEHYGGRRDFRRLFRMEMAKFESDSGELLIQKGDVAKGRSALKRAFVLGVGGIRYKRIIRDGYKVVLRAALRLARSYIVCDVNSER